MARKILTDLKVREVTFTVKGANQPAKITLFKSADQPVEEKSFTQADVHADRPMNNPNCRNCTQTVDHTDQYCKSCGVKFHKTENKMTAETKTETPATETVTEQPAEKTEQPAVEAPVVTETATEEQPAATTETAKTAEPVDVEKAALVSRVAELEKTLAAQVRVQKIADLTTEIGKSMKALPGVKAETFAPVLMQLRESAPEQAKAVEAVLVAASAAIEKGFEQKSAPAEKTGDAGVTYDSAVAEYDALIAKARAENPRLSPEAAGAMVLTMPENKSLYGRMLQEQTKSTR